jgi:hypothetical protein
LGTVWRERWSAGGMIIALSRLQRRRLVPSARPNATQTPRRPSRRWRRSYRSSRAGAWRCYCLCGGRRLVRTVVRASKEEAEEGNKCCACEIARRKPLLATDEGIPPQLFASHHHNTLLVHTPLQAPTLLLQAQAACDYPHPSIVLPSLHSIVIIITWKKKKCASSALVSFSKSNT